MKKEIDLKEQFRRMDFAKWFCENYCFICNIKMGDIPCGKPIIVIQNGGCMGIYDKETDRLYAHPLKCHYECYHANKHSFSKILSYKNIKKIWEADENGEII